MPQIPEPIQAVIDLGQFDAALGGITMTVSSRPEIDSLLASAELRAQANKALAGKANAEPSAREKLKNRILTTLDTLVVETNATDANGEPLPVPVAIRKIGGATQLALFTWITDFFSSPSADASTPTEEGASSDTGASDAASETSAPATPTAPPSPPKPGSRPPKRT